MCGMKKNSTDQSSQVLISAGSLSVKFLRRNKSLIQRLGMHMQWFWEIFEAMFSYKCFHVKIAIVFSPRILVTLSDLFIFKLSNHCEL